MLSEESFFAILIGKAFSVFWLIGASGLCCTLLDYIVLSLLSLCVELCLIVPRISVSPVDSVLSWRLEESISS